MSLVLLDTLRPEFNATDIGPGTTHPIRYSKAAFLGMVKRYVNNTVSFRNNGPLSFSLDAYNNSALSAGINSDGINDGILRWQTVLTSLDLSSDFGVSEFPGCPFADGVSDPREDANVHRSWALSQAELNVSLDLRFPRIEQSDWGACTEVWCAFSIGFVPGAGNIHFKCLPIADEFPTTGDEPFVIDTNFAGIDFAGAAIPNDLEIPLGDGTTSAFFLDPGTPNRYVITALGTNG